MQFSISTFWDSRVMHPETKISRILLSVRLHGKQFRISLKLYSTRDEWVLATSGIALPRKLSSAQKEAVLKLRDDIRKCEEKARLVFDTLPAVTKDSFIRFYKSDLNGVVKGKTSVYMFWEEKRAICLHEGRLGSANNIRDAIRSFKRYKSELYFEEVDEAFIKGYLNYMKQRGCSPTTASMFVRSLKSLFNAVIKQGVIPERLYPFKNISIVSSVKSKSVLYPEQIKALYNYKPIGVRESRAKDYFFFLYLCNGMNFKDMAYLKYSSIKGDLLCFQREKTKNTVKTASKEIQVYLNDEIKRIIKVWGVSSKSINDYIFPLTIASKTPAHNDRYRHTVKRVCNKKLAEIGRKLGFDVHLCLNLARHSFATTLKLNGTPISFISDAMGHSNTVVTEHYLKSLPTKHLKEMSDSLLNF